MKNEATKLSEQTLVDKKKHSTQLFKGRPVFLMVSLFMLLLVYPFFEQTSFGRFVLNGIFSLIMFSAAWAVHEKRIWLVISCTLGIPWIVINWTYSLVLAGVCPAIAHDSVMQTAAMLSHIFFTGFVEYSMLVAILRDQKVTLDTLYRAVSGYLMLGLLWAAAYALVGHYDSNAFGGAFLRGDRDQISWNNYLYFSYVTLSTLGYGDITPISAHARSLAILEMVVGPLYLAVLIARLVAMYSSERKKSN